MLRVVDSEGVIYFFKIISNTATLYLAFKSKSSICLNYKSEADFPDP